MLLAFSVGQHSGEQNRMHFSHIVAPGDKDIRMINVFVTPHGLIQAETG